jgi:hypothetical protein
VAVESEKYIAYSREIWYNINMCQTTRSLTQAIKLKKEKKDVYLVFTRNYCMHDLFFGCEREGQERLRQA